MWRAECRMVVAMSRLVLTGCVWAAQASHGNRGLAAASAATIRGCHEGTSQPKVTRTRHRIPAAWPFDPPAATSSTYRKSLRHITHTLAKCRHLYHVRFFQPGAEEGWYSRVADAADVESPLKPEELQVLRAQYEKEGEYVGLQTKFNYAWVRSAMAPTAPLVLV